MPTKSTQYAQTAQEQTLRAVRQSQQAAVDVVRTWADAVEKTIPETPPIPFAAQLPSPQEVVQTSFDFAEQLLKVQREFAENLVAASAPILRTKTPVATA